MSCHYMTSVWSPSFSLSFTVCVCINYRLFLPLGGALPIPQEPSLTLCSLWVWLLALWLNQQMDKRWNNKRMDMIPRYPLFLQLWPPLNWQKHVSYIWRVSLLWFSWITFTPGVKMHLRYTHLNWISLPLSKASTDCYVHLLSFSLFTPTACINDEFNREIQFTHLLCSRSTSVTGGTVLAQQSITVTSVIKSMCYCKCWHCLIQLLNTFLKSYPGLLKWK